MTNAAAQLSEYTGKFVRVELADHEGELREYKVEGAAPGGQMVLLRPKGKSSGELYEGAKVLRFEEPEAPEPAPLKARRKNPVKDEEVKRHLVDNHGYKVADINGLTLEQAVNLHEGLDHKELDLGHYHEVSKREQAIAEGGPSSDAIESQS